MTRHDEPAEGDVAGMTAVRVPPDCWPVCEYGVECPHEWRIVEPEGDVAGVEAVLAAHPSWEVSPFRAEWFCTGNDCDASGDYYRERDQEAWEEHRAHVADALRDLLAAAWDEGATASSGLSRATSNPYRATERAQ